MINEELTIPGADEGGSAEFLTMLGRLWVELGMSDQQILAHLDHLAALKAEATDENQEEVA